MKKIIAVFFFLFSALAASYGQNHDFQVLIGLNLNDCINCYSSGLNKIDQKADSVDVILVLSEVFETDSAKIINKYNLRGITKNIVWSDSLLRVLTGGGRSVIAFTSKYHNLIFRYDLEGLPDDLFAYLHRAGKSLDTLFPAYPNVALGVGDLNPFFVHGDRVFFINKILDKVEGYNLLSGKQVLDFSIPDSILKNTFAYSGIPSSQYEIQHKILQHAHMAPYQINSLIFNEDTVGVLFTNCYFTIEKDSTLRRDNVNLIKVVKGKVVKTQHFPIFFKNKLDQNKDYWADVTSMYAYEDTMYSFLYSMPDSGQNYDYHVFGSFKPDKTGSLVLNQLNPMKNPPLFKYSMACMFPVFNKGYFAFPLIDTLYSVAGNLPPIPLNIFPKKYKYKLPYDRCSKGFVIIALYITDDYVWVSFANNTDENHSSNFVTVVRHNRHTGENLFSKKKINFDYSLTSCFDPINPDYLLFTLPNKNGVLYRAKMF